MDEELLKAKEYLSCCILRLFDSLEMKNLSPNHQVYSYERINECWRDLQVAIEIARFMNAQAKEYRGG